MGGDQRATGFEPVSTRAMLRGADTFRWGEALTRVPEAATYWLTTVSSDGRAHLVPVLAVWVDGALHFSAGATTRKATNIASDPRCAVGVEAEGVDLVIEGEAVKVPDDPTLRRVAEAYASAYEWYVTPRDGAFHDAEGAPTAGPPPYEVYRLVPTTAFGLSTTGVPRPTRWGF